MIRVLIADDSPLLRSLLSDILTRDPEIEIAGTAGDGREAVEATGRLRPDLVIMDIMMPVMDGLEAVIEIMSRFPTPILVLSSHLDPKDSRSAFNAIKHGALDVMEKPRGIFNGGFGEISAQLIDKVKALAKVRVIHHFRRQRPSLPLTPTAPGLESRPRKVLAIGASTGGPKAVMRLLREVPRSTGASILIVQHIAPGFAAGFAEWLNRESEFDVRLARSGDSLLPGVALVAPNDRHLTLEGERVQLSDGPPVNCCRPAVDVLYNSLARSPLAPTVLAVLLTGMGRDGAEGMVELRRRGAYNIAQDEASSAVFGMPKAAIDLGAAHQILPLGEIPAAVCRLLLPPSP